MSRSIWKGPIIKTNNNGGINPESRYLTISPKLINKEVKVHNGKNILSIKIESQNIGKKLGCLVPTKIFKGHKKKLGVNKNNKK
jgi:ribosomal protein S19